MGIELCDSTPTFSLRCADLRYLPYLRNERGILVFIVNSPLTGLILGVGNDSRQTRCSIQGDPDLNYKPRARYKR